MERLIKGDVVVLPFPFTDLSSSKKRPNKIFTLSNELVLYKIGHLTNSKIDECIQKVCDIITSG